MNTREPQLVEWWVSVPNVGFIGTVRASNHQQARASALEKYGKDAPRVTTLRRPETLHIFENDTFEVMP